MATRTQTWTSDTEIVAPRTTTFTSDAWIIGPNQHLYLSDAEIGYSRISITSDCTIIAPVQESEGQAVVDFGATFVPIRDLSCDRKSDCPDLEPTANYNTEDQDD